MGFNVPIKTDERDEKIDELLAASKHSAKSQFGRELIDELYDKWQESDVEDPIDAITEARIQQRSADYDPDEYREEMLTAKQLKQILDIDDEPVISKNHVPTDIADDLSSTEKVELCAAVVRYDHTCVNRAIMKDIVEDVIGKGSNGYYIDRNKADIPGQVVDMAYHEPKIRGNDPFNGESTGIFISAEFYLKVWLSRVDDLYNIVMDGDIEDITKTKLSDHQKKAKKLREQGEKLMMVLNRDDELFPRYTGKVDDVYLETMKEVERRVREGDIDKQKTKEKDYLVEKLEG